MIRLRHFAILIFAIAVLEFAFFGIYRYMTADRKAPVLKVDRDEILEELIRTYINTRLRDVG